MPIYILRINEYVSKLTFAQLHCPIMKGVVLESYGSDWSSVWVKIYDPKFCVTGGNIRSDDQSSTYVHVLD